MYMYGHHDCTRVALSTPRFGATAFSFLFFCVSLGFFVCGLYLSFNFENIAEYLIICVSLQAKALAIVEHESIHCAILCTQRMWQLPWPLPAIRIFDFPSLGLHVMSVYKRHTSYGITRIARETSRSVRNNIKSYWVYMIYVLHMHVMHGTV